MHTVHTVAVVVAPPVMAFDVTIPEMVLGAAVVDGGPGYELLVCAAEPGRALETVGGLDVVAPHGLDAVDRAGTVLVVGSGGREGNDPRTLDALRGAAAAGKRIAAICTGAFVLAETGLLDGRRATTHWGLTAELARRFPAIDVVPDVLYVDDGPVLTSAGAAAGIELCLHLVRADHGAAVAAEAARQTVAAPPRPAGQAQILDDPLPAEPDQSLAATRAWALRRLDTPLTLAALARHARVSTRTLTRRFHAETGCSPLQWLLQQRIGRARELLETTTLSMDQVAARSGLGSADSLREHMVRRVGLTPSAYRSSHGRRAGGVR
ncbi:GlxA family transcriptional regulator [Actinomadura opuntiae]|uniref:GlxA family transcriptional regulator n=1 Tax=Actinomadura sp. OS1-43 TaxID=604315 RepID=UPI00255ADA28|nr:helix-turn-helix domain-containing protein [Actinomadura sp. OS1-43]MDL4816105.1 helix-turn-helix domain-containing protein [Actinomadura sp. OS1-43]